METITNTTKHPLTQKFHTEQIAKYNYIKTKASNKIATLEEEIKRLKAEIKAENLRIKDANENITHYSEDW